MCFFLKFCDFSALCHFCCSTGVLPACCVYTHWHRGKTEKGQSPEYYKIFGKTQYLMNTLYLIKKMQELKILHTHTYTYTKTNIHIQIHIHILGFRSKKIKSSYLGLIHICIFHWVGFRSKKIIKCHKSSYASELSQFGPYRSGWFSEIQWMEPSRFARLQKNYETNELSPQRMSTIVAV